ncbi:MAG: 23S rRNA (uracil(1939)-C(5))-methyltransferase RlmD, partial [Oscillospiraceae bacterium]|nr:23S rRNA (uracil(1939)-C(5))-methyltransferase RlmD [Oscillospiraceae bacterium]
EPIVGMEDPMHYRCKVHAAFGRGRDGKTVSGVYQAESHRIVAVENCMIEHEAAGKIVAAVKELLAKFKLQPYDEDRRRGFLRHVMVRVGRFSGEVMVVLVTASRLFPGKKEFVKELLRRCPEITTVVQNINDRATSMVLGKDNETLYGPGRISDSLCGLTFLISPSAFYQVNPVQTEVLYGTAMEFAALTGSELVVDAYCGTGTIGLIAAKNAGEVVGVELNRDAVKDAALNAKRNGIKNARFFADDAGKFLCRMAQEGQAADVVFMDPPRSGSSEEFLRALRQVKPEKIVYVSCDPDTLRRDLEILTKGGKYTAVRIRGVDMFPYTEHVETVVELKRG